MSLFVHACTDPITNITGPIYHLIRGDKPKQKQLQLLILAALRTLTVAALFFVIIASNRIFGSDNNVSRSFAFSVQFFIHPYAAALLNVFTNLIPPHKDIGGVIRAMGFCLIAHLLQERGNGLDQKYEQWSKIIALWKYPV